MKRNQLYSIILIFSLYINFSLATWLFCESLKIIEKTELKFNDDIQGERTFSYNLTPYYPARISVDAEKNSPKQIGMKIVALEINLNRTFILTKESNPDWGSTTYSYENGIFEFKNILKHQISYNVCFQIIKEEIVFPPESTENEYEITIAHNFTDYSIFYIWGFILSIPLLFVSILGCFDKYKNDREYFIPVLIIFFHTLIWIVFTISLFIFSDPFM